MLKIRLKRALITRGEGNMSAKFMLAAAMLAVAIAVPAQAQEKSIFESAAGEAKYVPGDFEPAPDQMQTRFGALEFPNGYPTEETVQDMATVQLADGQHVQSCDQHPHPTGHVNRVDTESEAVFPARLRLLLFGNLFQIVHIVEIGNQ